MGISTVGAKNNAHENVSCAEALAPKLNQNHHPSHRLGVSKLLLLCGLAVPGARAQTVSGDQRSLRFSYEQPQDGRSYCNKVETLGGEAQDSCLYLHRTPRADRDSSGGSACFAYAESYRELGVVAFDQHDRPSYQSIFLQPQRGGLFSNALPMGGILPDGSLTSDVRPFCAQLMNEELNAQREAGSPTSLRGAGVSTSTAYQACSQGKDYFYRGWWRGHDPGGITENHKGEKVIFALPGVVDTDSDFQSCTTSTDAKTGSSSTTCTDASCDAYAFAKPIVGFKKDGVLASVGILNSPSQDYVFEPQGYRELAPFCRDYGRHEVDPNVPTDSLREIDGMCEIQLDRMESIAKTWHAVLYVFGGMFGFCALMALCSNTRDSSLRESAAYGERQPLKASDLGSHYG